MGDDTHHGKQPRTLQPSWPKSRRSHEGLQKNVLYKKNASWSGGNLPRLLPLWRIPLCLSLWDEHAGPSTRLSCPLPTCTTKESKPASEVVETAKEKLEDGFGTYNLISNNCEEFATFCKTGTSFYQQANRR
ncbi:hypothetical protein H0E87_009911 [Populus deltoides]|uniref:LRAT domain-containing protein n=1 Tax=Populus deltoides TaxID=3696 RepID=A0A8T2YR43_POPDE|nr:hypothetical protein H0E87_009911 [Populus deltoides]